tara:strand:+ start:4820 stop:5356 length:537 start_codon:yes stop_codon:yes gene_type:complete
MSFNVVINSPNTIDDLTQGSVTTNELRYNFDWNFMDDCEYDLTFSFRTPWQNLGVTVNPVLTQIRIPDLGAAMSVYEVVKNTTGVSTTASKSNVIGNVTTTEKFYGVTKNSNTGVLTHHSKVMYSAGAADNGPVRLKSRPQSSTFTVKLCQPSGETPISANAPLLYSLVLHFKKIDRY